ncbi:MAG TPA: NAD(+) diphosphatase [Myxococcota bacterium]|nr:NAD(+) diphosphatase [Myxococcota bacterium]
MTQQPDTKSDRPRDPSLTFVGSPLDREATRRRDRDWLEARLADTSSRFLPLWKLQPLVKHGASRALAWARRDFFADLEPAPEPVLLGSLGDVAHFAVDVSAAARPEESFGIADVARFEDLRGVVPLLPQDEAAISAQARALVDWHARHGFCAACGGGTRAVCGGAHRVCTECQAEHFPRTDPVAIAIVVQGPRCLLGRQRGWPASMYSALAGFVEAGESLEEALRREVKEEAGVQVGDVRYWRSQPWPFPSSLMLGCIADALSETIRIDPAELEDARWFTREEIAAALAGAAGPLMVPPPFSIAHQLLRAWIGGAIT